MHSRIIEDINRDFLAVFIYGFLNFEGPKQSSYANEGALLCQCLANTDPSSPAECHIAPLSWKGTIVATVFEVSVWIESIRFREVSLVSVNGPQIALNPCVFGYQPTLVLLVRPIK